MVESSDSDSDSQGAGLRDSAYWDVVTNSRVCAYCHALLVDEFSLPKRIPERRSGALDPRSPRPDSELDTPLGDSVTARSPTRRCDNCGHFDAPVFVRDPLPKAKTIRFAGNLSDTADLIADEHRRRGNEERAERYRHDRDVLFDVARYLKSQPEYQRRDAHIFASALEIARRRIG